MTNEIERLKTAVVTLVGKIQDLRREHVALDAKAASAYRAARGVGVDVKVAKQVILALHGEHATADEIWKQYAASTGIPAADIAADGIGAVSPLDAI